mgnify:CR=1 FL=1
MLAHGLETDALRLLWNQSGRLVSIYDKKAGRELVPEGQEANALTLYEDRPREYDAWELEYSHQRKPWELPAPSRVSIVENSAVRAVADVVAMGTGTPAAVRGEWTRGGLSGYTDAVFAAPQDGKAEALIPVFGAGYLPSHMLVVGDTLGDAALAAQAGALFFPILPGREEACWQRLAEEGFPKFLHGSFAGAYEDTLRKAQRSLLP